MLRNTAIKIKQVNHAGCTQMVGSTTPATRVAENIRHPCVRVLNTSRFVASTGTIGKKTQINVHMLSNITFKAQYNSSKRNSAAYSISRSQWVKFRDLMPDADVWRTPIRKQIWHI